MKKYLIILLLLLPVLCSGDTIHGISCGGATFGFVQRMIPVGTSITKGTGDVLPYGDDIGGWRKAFQDLTRAFSFTGQWGNEVGTNDSGVPTLETRDTDENYLLKYDYQPRHFAWAGGNIEMMVDAFSDLDQLSWFYTASEKNLVTVNLGTNEAWDEFLEPDPCSAPDNCTSARIVDPSNIVGYVTKLMTIVDVINAGESPHPSINFDLITPMSVDPADTDKTKYVGYLDDWAVLFNAELVRQIEEKILEPTSNLFYTDLYTPMAGANWYNGVYSYPANVLHPNNGGYKYIARIKYNKIVQEGLIK